MYVTLKQSADGSFFWEVSVPGCRKTRYRSEKSLKRYRPVMARAWEDHCLQWKIVCLFAELRGITRSSVDTGALYTRPRAGWTRC